MINAPLNRRLRMALCGGGGAGFIGKVHRTAATLDGRADLVSGAFSSNVERSRESAVAFGVDPKRAFADFQALLDDERARLAAERVDFLSIATPNYLHFPMAKAALEAGFNVICWSSRRGPSLRSRTTTRVTRWSGRRAR
jgi:predicted dehydrogenase